LDAVDAQLGGHAHQQLAVAAWQRHRQLQLGAGRRLCLRRLIQAREQAGVGGLQHRLPQQPHPIDHGKAVAALEPQHPLQVMGFSVVERQPRA